MHADVRAARARGPEGRGFLDQRGLRRGGAGLCAPPVSGAQAATRGGTARRSQEGMASARSLLMGCAALRAWRQGPATAGLRAAARVQ